MSHSRHFQVAKWADLKKWHQSFSLGPAFNQTNPPSTDTLRPASLATDDEGVTADDKVSAIVEKSEEAVDEGQDLVEDVVVKNCEGEIKEDESFVCDSDKDNYQLSRQIAKKEEKLLKIWEQGPAQVTVSQDMRVSYLEEKLAKSIEDNEYLEALLKVRDNDFARYLDLERQQRRHASHLLEEVNTLYDQLEKKDKSLRLALRKLDMVRKAAGVHNVHISAGKW